MAAYLHGEKVQPLAAQIGWSRNLAIMGRGLRGYRSRLFQKTTIFLLQICSTEVGKS